MSLSIVLPCFNEQENITGTVEDVCAFLRSTQLEGEVIAVNDGSLDETQSVLERLSGQYPELHVLQHDENQGYGAALTTGLDAATMEYSAFMDSDGQFHAEDLGLLLPHLENHTFVAGRRSRRADPVMRSMNALLYGLLVKIALRIFVRDINCGMKVFKTSIWQQIRPRYATGALFNAEVFLRLKENKIPWTQIPVQHYPRTAGNPTGAKISVILKMFYDLFRLKGKQKSEKEGK